MGYWLPADLSVAPGKPVATPVLIAR
jgi:hypothetical protein